MSMSAAFGVTQLFGGFTQAYGEYQEAKQQSAAQEANASIARGEASVLITGRSLERSREKAALLEHLSMQRARYAAAGVRISGSPLTVMEHDAAQAELDIIINDINASIEANRLMNEGQLSETAAKETRTAAKLKLGSTLLSTTTSAGSGLLAPSGNIPRWGYGSKVGSAGSGTTSSLGRGIGSVGG